MSDERDGPDPAEGWMGTDTEPPADETLASGPADLSPTAPEPEDLAAVEAPFAGILPEAPIEPPPVVTLPGAPPRREPSPAGPSGLPGGPAGLPGGPAGRPRREESDRSRSPRGPRPELVFSTEPLYRDRGGYRMRLEPPDLARLRELPGSKGKTDQELGEAFFDGYSERFVTSLAEDVPAPAEVRVVVDPYSRQAFLAVERKIRSILSF